VRTCFDPGEMIIVGVGKKAEVLSQLAAFGTPKHYHFKEQLERR
jgi:hypothetical protein